MQSILKIIIFFSFSVKSAIIPDFSGVLTLGSLMGGLELRFRIIGFDTDPSNNQIYVGDNQCLITDDGSRGLTSPLGQILRCTTTQTNINQTLLPFILDYPNNYNSQNIDAQVKLKVKGQQDLINIFIRQSVYATPLLYQIVGCNIYPESLILFQYSIKEFGSQDIKFFIGQHLCQLIQSIPFNNLINSYCKVPEDIEAGYYNVTIKAPSGTQYNRLESFQQDVTTQGQYQVLIIPQVTKLSSNLASKNGQVLTIYGNGFTQFIDRIQLSITGQNIIYDVLEANQTQIRVMIKNYSSDYNYSKYLQSSGLFYTKYNLSDYTDVQNCSYLRQYIQDNNTELNKQIMIETIISQPEYFSIQDSNYGEYYRSYFKAPYDANYTFLLSSNDNVEFYFQQTEGFSNNDLKLIAFTNQGAINFRDYKQQTDQISEVQHLAQGNYYYFEIYHYGNSINSNLTLSVQIKQDNLTTIYQPIPNQLLYLFSELPQINLYIKGILSICSICQYQLTQNNYFKLQSFTKNDQILQLKIKQEQSNIQLQLNQLTISYGGVSCNVLNLTKSNSISIVNCILEQQNGIVFCEAGVYPIGVINSDSSIQPITQNIVITKVTPSVGSRDGGTYLTIDGNGFPVKNQGADFIIKIGGNRVYPTYLDNHRINVVTGPYQGSSTIEIQFNNKTYKSDQFFQYEQQNPIKIYNLSNYSFSPIYKGFLTIYARNLVYDKSVLNVTFENSDKTYIAPIVSIQNDELQVYLRGGMPGDYTVNIYKNGYEKSISETNKSNIFQYGVFISDVSPSHGSLFGGTTLKIIGQNFVIEESLVFIGKGVNQVCEIDELVSNETYIECVTAQKPSIASYDNPVDIAVVTRALLESVCINIQGCKFQYTDESTPKLENLPDGVQLFGSRLLVQQDEINNQFYNNHQRIKEQLKLDHQQMHHRILQQSKQHLKQRLLSQFTSYKYYYQGDNETLNFIGELNNPPKIILQGYLYNFVIDTQIIENAIQYQVPNIPQGDYRTYVLFDQGYADKQWISSIPFDFLEVDADEISYGGQLITITGSGFNLHKGLKIRIQDQDCLSIKLISNSQVQCRTPILNTGMSDLILQQNDQQTSSILNATTSLIIKTKKKNKPNIFQFN